LQQKIEALGRKIIDRLGEDKFTPLERLEKLRRFEEPDRVTGSFVFWNPLTIGIRDVSQKEYYTNPGKMYYCQLRALDLFKHDYPVLLADNYNTEPEALGAKVSFTGDDTPILVSPALQCKEALSGLGPPDPFTDGRLPYRLEICRIHHDVLGKYFPTVTSINAPFSMAVGMRGYENLAVDMVEDPDFVHNLLEFCTGVIIDYGNAVKKVCGSYPSIVDAWSSLPNLSPKFFQEFSFPYAARCVEALGHCSWSFGGGHQFSGDWKTSLRMQLATGMRSFSLFEENITGIRGGRSIPLKEIKEICRNRQVFLFTSLHPDTMLEGPSERIEGLIRDWTRDISSGGGLGFYTSVLLGTPIRHIEAFVESIRRSAYPTS